MARILDVSVTYRRTFYFVASGLTPTVSISKAGGSFNASTNAVVEIASGFYYLDLTTTETNTVGDLAYTFGSLGLGIADPDNRDQVGQLDVNVVACGGTAVPAGAIPNAAAGASGGLLRNGTNTGAISFDSGFTITNAGGNALSLNGSSTGLAITGNTGVSITATGSYGLNIDKGCIIGNSSGGIALTIQGTNNYALSVTSTGANPTVVIAGGATSGNAITISSTNGNPIAMTAGGTNKDAIILTPTGTGYGINGTLSGATAGLDAAGTRAALGLASANLDTQLGAISSSAGSSATSAAAAATALGTAGNGLSNIPPTKIQSGVTKNAAIANFMFPMYSVTDHSNPLTGLTITATRSIDGGSFAACANSASEIGTGGIYKINLAASDLNGTTITLKFAAAGAETRIINIITTP